MAATAVHDVREIENRVERIPATPDRLYVLNIYAIRSGAESEFESSWRNFAAHRLSQSGCEAIKLHHDLEKPSQYMCYDLWQDRKSLVAAIRTLGTETTYPTSSPTRQTFVQLVDHVGSTNQAIATTIGQVATLRIFSLKVKSEPQFERLWAASARHEIKQNGCLYKKLHRDLNLPTRYVSYSLWANSSASDEAASQHDHYQRNNTPYPLATPVIRSKLKVIASLHV
jgi:quinol monooxygenase YgiN